MDPAGADADVVMEHRATAWRRPRLFALLLTVSLMACTRTASERWPQGPIVLVVVDTLRADHVTCYGYPRPTTPSICRLARDGVTFERAYTPRTATTPAIASVFTGLYPHRHGVRRLYQVLPLAMETLAEQLHQHGYKTGGFVSSFVMVRDFSGFDQGFDIYDDLVATREPFRENFERSARDTVDWAVAWLRTAGPHAFLFVHLIEPHGPYTPPSPFAERFALPADGPRATDVPGYQKIPGVSFVSEYVGRYDGEIAAADDAIGRLLETLRTFGWYESATIVLMADHGESMGEEGLWFQHGHSVHDAEARVPLIIKFAVHNPQAVPRASRVTEPVSLVDLFPTMLAAADIQTRVAGSSGVDLQTVAAGQPRTAPPPLTELQTPRGIVVALHGSECSGRWMIADTNLAADNGLADTTAPQRWNDIAVWGQRLPNTADRACQATLASAAAPLVNDLQTFRLAVPVVRRADIKRPGAKAQYLARRGVPVTPLSERDSEALRHLGYAE
jgi:arylsulfatase